MRKLIVTLLAVLALSAVVEGRERFVGFPAVGKCTGDYVRYRRDPGTDGEAFPGRLNTGDRVIVQGQTKVEGQVWYEIDSPEDDGSAFVFGKYIEPYYSEDDQREPVIKLITEILSYYGISEKRGKLYDDDNVKRTYRGAQGLVYVDVSGEGQMFGEIAVGDEVGKVREVLGEPESESAREWEYRFDVDTLLIFRVKDGKVTRMIYDD